MLPYLLDNRTAEVLRHLEEFLKTKRPTREAIFLHRTKIFLHRGQKFSISNPYVSGIEHKMNDTLSISTVIISTAVLLTLLYDKCNCISRNIL